MASLWCSFPAGAAMASSISMENPASLGSTSRCNSRFSFPAFYFYPRTTSLLSGANGAEFGSLKCADGDPFAGFSSNSQNIIGASCKGKLRRKRNRALRATGKNAIEGEDADDETYDLYKLEKGKEVQDKQKNLLHQVYLFLFISSSNYFVQIVWDWKVLLDVFYVSNLDLF